MNLNIPDEDPKLAATNSQMYKKRFSITEYNSGQEFESRRIEERENKIPRTAFKPKSAFLASMDCDVDDDDAMNLSTSNRRAANSLMDLSAACESERRQMSVERPGITLTSSSMSSLSSSNSSINCSSSSTATFPSIIVRKPLQNNTGHNVKFVQLSSNPGPVNRWVGVGRSKTVIALVSPTNPASTCYPAVQTSPVSLVMKKRTSFD